MILEGLRVGYVPYGSEMTAPGDRRRFCFYAERRAVPFEIAHPDRDYDLVVLSPRADIGSWSRYRGRAKLIYQLIDSYLAVPRFQLRSLLRGAAKFASGETSVFLFDYRRAIERMCRRADAVVCTTDEQRQTYLRLCPNVHRILDAHSELAPLQKSSFAIGDTANLVWEGLPYTLSAFEEIAPVLRSVSAKRPLALHLVTDLHFSPYAGHFGRRSTKRIARSIFPNTFVYEWNRDLLPHLVVACDLAVIPLDLTDPFSYGKPENKLLIFWRLGMPTLTSASPAYRRAMLAAGLDLTCGSADQWEQTLLRVLDNESLRAEASQRGSRYVIENHNEERLLARWDALFESVLA